MTQSVEVQNSPHNIMQRLIHILLQTRGDHKFRDYMQTIHMPDGSQWIVEVRMIHRAA